MGRGGLRGEAREESGVGRRGSGPGSGLGVGGDAEVARDSEVLRRLGAPFPRGALECGPPSPKLQRRPGRGRRGFRNRLPHPQGRRRR